MCPLRSKIFAGNTHIQIFLWSSVEWKFASKISKRAGTQIWSEIDWERRTVTMAQRQGTRDKWFSLFFSPIPHFFRFFSYTTLKGLEVFHYHNKTCIFLDLQSLSGIVTKRIKMLLEEDFDTRNFSFLLRGREKTPRKIKKRKRMNCSLKSEAESVNPKH